MDIIYSRRKRFSFKGRDINNNNNNNNNNVLDKIGNISNIGNISQKKSANRFTISNKTKKIFKFIFIIIIAITTMIKMTDAVNIIIEKQCLANAKAIATKISNEEATKVMSKYEYEDLFHIIKDSNRKCFNDKCKCNCCK